jgi:hypothetical protein
MNYQHLVKDFALRTQKNLHTLRNLQTSDPKSEVYEVTQLISSMLGLLVFPQQQYVTNIPKVPLSTLASQGWPVPKIVGDYPQVEDLNQLVRFLRNAVAHFNLKFLSDTDGHIRGLEVWNRDPRRKAVTWKAELTVEDIEKISQKFIELLLDGASEQRLAADVVIASPS